ncbi:hypothetical protein KOR42_18120 [Thalassoglobus neptunius]|uniref:Uncharacterized protein n=1 Tax=Thalassoglobus neptunius TaxID=1938619 RepID=A0A5C5X6N7_9PLAN|nr:hypothetical protein KOR42_18120 [Thalassoglobus neptunius]
MSGEGEESWGEKGLTQNVNEDRKFPEKQTSRQDRLKFSEDQCEGKAGSGFESPNLKFA